MDKEPQGNIRRPVMKMDLNELPGPLQAVWNDVYQLVVKNLRADGVDLPIAKSRARRAAEEHVELMWDETKHPRWAVGTGVGPGGEGGGRFRPKGAGGGTGKSGDDVKEGDEEEEKTMPSESRDLFVKSVSSHDEPAADILKSSLDSIYGDEYPQFIEDKLNYYQLKKDMKLDGEYIAHKNGVLEIRVKSTLGREEKVDSTTHEFIHALSADKYETSKTFKGSVDAEYKSYLKPLAGKSIDDMGSAPSNYISHTAYESPEEYLSEAGVFYYNKGKKRMVSPGTILILRQLTRSKK